MLVRTTLLLDIQSTCSEQARNDASKAIFGASNIELTRAQSTISHHRRRSSAESPTQRRGVAFNDLLDKCKVHAERWTVIQGTCTQVTPRIYAVPHPPSDFDCLSWYAYDKLIGKQLAGRRTAIEGTWTQVTL